MINFINKIEAIKTTDKGEKLIAFSRVYNFRKCKPQVSPSVFCAYRDGILSIYNRNDFTVFQCKTFKEALVIIFQFTDF